MPRKQRFKPNRKSKSATHETQHPVRDPASRADEPDDLNPRPPETARRETRPHDVEVAED